MIGLANGSFVIDWTDDGDVSGNPSGSGVFAPGFLADGTRLGSQSLANTITDGPQNAFGMAALTKGRHVITYYDGSGSPSDTSV